jgi:hypothetical protein
MSIYGQVINITFLRGPEIEPPSEAITFAGLVRHRVRDGEVFVYGDGGGLAKDVGQEMSGVVEDVLA